MGHDYLTDPVKDIEPEWLSRLIHIHVHDVDASGIDHFPLIYNRVPYTDWLSKANKAGFTGIATLEIKGGNLAGWSGEDIQDALIHSIRIMHQGLQ
jgi:sugar phosphate isomerase/epimerase